MPDNGEQFLLKTGKKNHETLREPYQAAKYLEKEKQYRI
jgi:hypothetical protein